jgi:hypothetical protein
MENSSSLRCFRSALAIVIVAMVVVSVGFHDKTVKYARKA